MAFYNDQYQQRTAGVISGAKTFDKKSALERAMDISAESHNPGFIQQSDQLAQQNQSSSFGDSMLGHIAAAFVPGLRGYFDSQKEVISAPFEGKGMEAQALNNAIIYQEKKRRGIPTTSIEDAAFELSKQRLARPEQVVLPNGEVIMRNPYDLSGIISQQAAQSVMPRNVAGSISPAQMSVFENAVQPPPAPSNRPDWISQKAESTPETVKGLEPLENNIASLIASGRTSGKMTNEAFNRAKKEIAISGFTSSSQALDSLSSLEGIIKTDMETVDKKLASQNTPTSRAELLQSKQDFASALSKVGSLKEMIQSDPTLAGGVGSARSLIETVGGIAKDVSPFLPEVGGLGDMVPDRLKNFGGSKSNQESGRIKFLGFEKQ